MGTQTTRVLAVSYNKGKKTSPGLRQFMERKQLPISGDAEADIKTCHGAGYFRQKNALDK